MSKRFTYYGGIQAGLLPYLTAYWTADNIATDVHINNLGGTFNLPNYNSGINNNAFDFDNSVALRYVEVPNNNLLSFTDGTNDIPFTISMWAYFYSFSNTGNWLINKRGNLSIVQEWQIIFYQNQISFARFSQTSSSDYVISNTGYIPPFNQWIHLVYTCDGSKFGGKIYANGIDITSSNVEVGNYVKMDFTNTVTRFGNAGMSVQDRFKHRGMIDELAIFNGTELTQLQIQDLYNGGVGKFYPNI